MLGDHHACRQRRVFNRRLKKSPLAQAISPTALQHLLQGTPGPLEALLAWSSLSLHPHSSPEQVCKYLCETPLQQLVGVFPDIFLPVSSLPRWFVRACCKRLRKLMQLQVCTVLQDAQPARLPHALWYRPVGCTILQDYVATDLESRQRRWQELLDETRLLMHARAGNREACMPLLTPYLMQACASIRRHSAADPDVQDVVQETWASVLATLSSYDPTRGNLAAFVMHVAHTMRRRAYARQEKPHTLARRWQRLSRLQRGKETLLLPLMYEELVRFTFSGVNPPHQAIAYGLCRLLEWLPREVVTTLSGVPLRTLASRLEQEYLCTAQPPGSRLRRLRSYFAPLHQAMHLPLGAAVHDPKTRHIYKTLLPYRTGHTALEAYFRDKTNIQLCAKELVSWCWAVQRRLHKALA